jgi:pimeloyl-ACP methyl ester carboxylesterase
MGAVRFGAKAAAALLLLLILILAGFRLAAAWREGGAPTPAAISLVETRYGRIAVAFSGPADGPPILLVHGSVGWSGFWRDVSAHLAARGWRVAAVDLPPFGWSDRDPAERYDRVSEAERLADLLNHVAKRPAVVVGHSFGGGPATELALRDPRLVRSLVLVDAALGPPDPEPGRGAAAGALAFAPLAQGLTAATVTNPAATGPLVRPMLARKEAAEAWLPTLRAPMRRSGTTAAYAAWLPNLFARDDGALSRRSRALAAIRVPVALIWGGADTVTPLDQGRRIAGLTRARSFAVLPGLGHIPHIEDPEAFLAALDSAIAPDREGETK